MNYTNDYFELAKKFDVQSEFTHLPEHHLKIRSFNFESENNHILAGGVDLIQKEKDILSNHSDSTIAENKKFKYWIFFPDEDKQYENAVILLHGLNERKWIKYLCWAKSIVINTGKPVILFPISFHMNRAPQSWADRRKMVLLFNKRISEHPDEEASYVNAAISERLTNIPERFACSGFQTIMDIVDMAEQIKMGTHSLFKKHTSLDFFGYSIGALITQMLMLTNPKNLFEKSKFFLFCGGSVFEKMNGMSKYILDSVACKKLKDFYSNEKNWEKSPLPFLELLHVKDIGTSFQAMIRGEWFKKLRDDIFSALHKQIFAISLLKDHIIPPEGIIDTLIGARKYKTSTVQVVDFPFQYSHVAPFPAYTDTGKSIIVDDYFEDIFSQVAAFFNREH